MTKRFYEAVKAVVQDGVISEDERALLKEIANEEKINSADANIYIVNLLKRRKEEIIEKRSTHENNVVLKPTSSIITNGATNIMTVLTTAASILGTVLKALNAVNEYKKNKKE